MAFDFEVKHKQGKYFINFEVGCLIAGYYKEHAVFNSDNDFTIQELERKLSRKHNDKHIVIIHMEEIK